MADHALFYNSVDHDRVYNADSFSDWLKKFFTTGVFTGDLFVTAAGSMTVSVGTGHVNINGKVMIYGAATQLTLDPANGIYPRIDTIVVERNDTDRDFYLKVITGDYANLNDPVPTPPVRSGAVYQLVLAQIYVGAGVTEITQANITDTRADSDLCGIVTGTVTEMDFSQFAAQFAEYYQEFQNGYEADFENWSDAQRQNFANWMADEENTFDTWFANLHYVLDGDVAGHLQNEIDEIKAGMSGSILNIHTNESTLVGKTVTVTGATQTLTATISNSGDAQVLGLMDVGNVTITASDGTDTATTVINIPYFSNYPVTLAFWQATVNIQGDENIYGETVSVSNSSHILVETITLDPNDGTGVFYASRPDTYTFSVEYEGETYSESVTVSEETTYSVELMTMPNGETVTPTDDIQIWLKCAGIKDKAYTTLNEVLADSVTYNALLGDSNACAYMKRSTTWSTDICASQYAMNLLGQYDTACDALLSDSTWASAIANSTYADSVISALVPIMTSNTTPSGVAFASSTLSGRDNYRAFDGNPSTDWSSSDATYPQSIGYQSPTPMCVKKISFTRRVVSGYTNNVVNVILQGSNDGQTWSDIGEAWNLRETDSTNSVEEKAFLNNSQYYSYHQLKYLSLVSGSDNINPTCVSLQFYGHAKSGEKIHGGNPTYDSFYRIVDGNNVPVTDPSLLDAGTYTIYSNGLAKNPSDLSADYGKTVRICPNTKEIVVRPDKTLYWYGVMPSIGEDLISANGWSWNQTMTAGTHNEKDIQFASSSNVINGVASKYSIDATTVHAIYNGSTASSNVYGYLLNSTTKSNSGINDTQTIGTSGLSHSTLSATGGYAICLAQAGMAGKLSALWYE